MVVALTIEGKREPMERRPNQRGNWQEDGYDELMLAIDRGSTISGSNDNKNKDAPSTQNSTQNRSGTSTPIRSNTQGQHQQQQRINNDPYAYPNLGKCFRCNQPGHLSNNCPNRRSVNFVEEGGNEEEQELEEDIYEGAEFVEDVEKKWHALSNDFCLPQKIQTILNDIKYSGLDTLFIAWIKKGPEVQVLEVCKIPLSIRKYYKDEIVQEVLVDFPDLSPNELPNELPPMQNIQHHINLVLGASLPNLPHYLPTLLTPKKDGSWRMCVDSCTINKIMVKYRFPIPHLNDMLDSKDGQEHLSHLKEVLLALQANKLYINLKKCSFMTSHFLFLGFIVGKDGIQVDETKMKAIREWPALKNRQFQWGKAQKDNLESIKAKLCTAPVLALSNFEKVFEVECDASVLGIGVVLSQEGRPVEFLVRRILMLLMRILVAYGHDATIRSLLLTSLFKIDFYFEIEFAFNSMPNHSTKKTPFEVVYTSVPRHTVDLIRLPLSHDVNSNAEEFAGIQQIHQVKKNLKDANLHYKNTVDRHRRLEGDLVIVHLCKNHFPTGMYNKLKDKKIGDFSVFQKIGDNA
ncbi:hypothetical protein CK203_081418 [Vitis vinifera]|uniref:CCHC-type domain-containing protein n=1 Tax=Vitis vinifera TaxID=29760 RepID=A0A438DG14_VITVI|nr:hypothetical protein CK203_081418 [Vitis vinifera]